MNHRNLIERHSRAYLRFVPTLPVALTLAVLAGWLMDLGFPDRDWWPLTLLGTAVMMASVRGVGFGKALIIGAIGGFSFYGIMIWWLTVYLGLVPWIALTLLQVLFFALGMALIALIWRYGSRHWDTIAGRLGIVPALVGGAWMLREALASVFPFGGFAWGRIAQSQSEGPLASLVAWVGTSGMSFLLAWAAALVVALVAETRLPLESRASLGVAVALALLVWPAYPVTTSGSLRVLAVQGNADAG
ncbi:MAG: apolipoprotein N-acyltransferase, partial [Pontimonas sp.]|nr:apolipoprotein N-acyltransferase [Pontimonas sp.]